MVHPAPQSLTSPRRGREVFFFVLRTGLAAGIVGWLVWHNSGELPAVLRAIRPGWLAVAVVLYAIQLLAGAWRWHLLLRVQEVRLPFRETFSLMMQGIFFSLVLPSAIGGDVIKGGLLAPRIVPGRRLHGLFTILVDRIMGMMSLFTVVGVVGIFALGFLRGLEGYLELLVYVVLCGCAGGLAAAIGLFFHRQLEKLPPVAALLGWADRLTHGAVHQFAQALDAFRAAWPTLLGCFVLGVVCIHLPLAVAIGCLAHGFGAEPIDPLLIVLATALGNTVGAIPATPSGVGTRDYVIKEMLVAAGMASGAAVATTMVFTGMILGFNLLGGLFFIGGRRARRATGGEVRPADEASPAA